MKILIIDDDKILRATLRRVIQYEGFEVEEAENGAEGLKKIKDEGYQIVFCDIRMPEIDGIEVLERVKKFDNPPLIIMISVQSDAETIVKAIKRGAFDFFSKPIDMNRFTVTLHNAVGYSELSSETTRLKELINKANEMIGEAKPIDEIKELLCKVELQ